MACEFRVNALFQYAVLISILILGCRGKAQAKATHTPVFDLPSGPMSHISSPDRRWTLIFECPDYTRERKLWITDNRSHVRRFIRDFERSVGISWAPNSQLFFVEDAYASNETLSYVFDPATLKVSDLAELLRAADPQSANYIQVGHSYLKAERWLNSYELIVSLKGYYDDPPPRGYSLKYRVNVDGKVQKIYQHLDGNWR